MLSKERENMSLNLKTLHVDMESGKVLKDLWISPSHIEISIWKTHCKLPFFYYKTEEVAVAVTQ